jgi:hypothetical protein
VLSAVLNIFLSSLSTSGAGFFELTAKGRSLGIEPEIERLPMPHTGMTCSPSPAT